MRATGLVAGLVALWLLAWGEVSLANVASGVVVAVALLLAFPPRARGHEHGARLRPLGALRLVVYVAGQLFTSNYLVAREVLSPRRRVRSGVLAYELQHPSDEVLTLMANVSALTPGTMTVEASREPAVLSVHFLLLEDVGRARRSLARLERLAAGALGHPVVPLVPEEEP